MARRGRFGPLGDDRRRPRRGACRAGLHRARGAVPGVVPAFGRVGVGGAAARVRGDRRLRGRRGEDARDAHQRGREPRAALAGGAVCRRGRDGRDAGPGRAGPPDRLPPAAVAGGAGGPRRARSRRSRRRRGAGRLDLRSRGGARARPDLRADGRLPALLRRVARHRFAVLTGPPEMGKTAIARMLGLGARDRGLGGARVHPARAGLGARSTASARSCSSPTTRSARPSTGPTRPSAGRSTSTASSSAWTPPLARVDVAACAAHARASAASTASTGVERFPQAGRGACRRDRPRPSRRRR